MTENDTAADSTVKGIALYQLGQEKDKKLQHTTGYYMTEHIKTLRSDAFDGAVWYSRTIDHISSQQKKSEQNKAESNQRDFTVLRSAE